MKCGDDSVTVHFINTKDICFDIDRCHCNDISGFNILVEKFEHVYILDISSSFDIKSFQLRANQLKNMIIYSNILVPSQNILYWELQDPTEIVDFLSKYNDCMMYCPKLNFYNISSIILERILEFIAQKRLIVKVFAGCDCEQFNEILKKIEQVSNISQSIDEIIIDLWRSGNKYIPIEMLKQIGPKITKKVSIKFVDIWNRLFPMYSTFLNSINCIPDIYFRKYFVCTNSYNEGYKYSEIEDAEIKYCRRFDPNIYDQKTCDF
jgi:hypothetical protein